jgi:hypothetical protein
MIYLEEGVPQKVAGRFGVVRQGGVWYIAEIVTAQGHWITHETAYGTEESCRKRAAQWDAEERS